MRYVREIGGREWSFKWFGGACIEVGRRVDSGTAFDPMPDIPAPDELSEDEDDFRRFVDDWVESGRRA